MSRPVLAPKFVAVDPVLTGPDGRLHVTGKTCRMCGILKTLDGFHKNKNTSDGRVSYCKLCARERERRRRYRIERLRSLGRPVPIGTYNKTCPLCERTLGKAQFYRSGNTLDGRGTYCKDCVRRHNRKTRSERKFRTRDRLQELGVLSERTRYILEELGEETFIRMVAQNRFPEVPDGWASRFRKRKRGRPQTQPSFTKIADGESARKKALQFRRGLLEAMGLPLNLRTATRRPMPIDIEPVVADRSAYDRLYGEPDQE